VAHIPLAAFSLTLLNNRPLVDASDNEASVPLIPMWQVFVSFAIGLALHCQNEFTCSYIGTFRLL
jgi:hypothetical protein